MNDLKSIIAQNIVSLRRDNNLTQSELAEKLNYSDKAVSKWERGESLPDITVLKAIADMFGVTVDYLISEDHPTVAQSPENPYAERKKRRHTMVTGMSVILVWVIATLIFVILDLSLEGTGAHFLTFAYAVPASAVVWLVFNSLWHNRRFNYPIVSIIMWSILASVHLSTIAAGTGIWQLYLIGIPGQIIILLWSKIGKKG